MIERKCKRCGKVFKITEKGQNPRKYCGRECASISRLEWIADYREKKKKQTIKYVPVKSTDIEVKVTFPEWVVKQKGAKNGSKQISKRG